MSSDESVENTHQPITGFDVMHWFVTRVLSALMVVVAVVEVFGL